jgi:hypothetical protein
MKSALRIIRFGVGTLITLSASLVAAEPPTALSVAAADLRGIAPQRAPLAATVPSVSKVDREARAESASVAGAESGAQEALDSELQRRLDEQLEQRLNRQFQGPI